MTDALAPVTGEPDHPAVIVVERDGPRHVARELRPGAFLAPKPLTSPPGVLRIALVGTRAGLLAGDDLRLRVEVGAGARLELVEPAGLVAYHHRNGPPAHWTAHLTLGAGAHLCWAAQPFVVSTGAHVERTLHAELAPGAGLLWRELLVLGRTGESGGAVRTRTRVHHAGAELLVEDQDFRDTAHRALPGILGPAARAVGTVTVVGVTPDADPDDPTLTRLAGAGAQVRHLGDSTLRVNAALDRAWGAWHSCGDSPIPQGS